MRVKKRPVGGNTASESRNSLQLTDNPAVGARCHQHHVVHDRMFAVNAFAAIEDLEIVFGRIMQFENVSLWRVKDGFQLVGLVLIAATKAVLLLSIHLRDELGAGIADKQTIDGAC